MSSTTQVIIHRVSSYPFAVCGELVRRAGVENDIVIAWTSVDREVTCAKCREEMGLVAHRNNDHSK